MSIVYQLIKTEFAFCQMLLLYPKTLLFVQTNLIR